MKILDSTPTKVATPGTAEAVPFFSGSQAGVLLACEPYFRVAPASANITSVM